MKKALFGLAVAVAAAASSTAQAGQVTFASFNPTAGGTQYTYTNGSLSFGSAVTLGSFTLVGTAAGIPIQVYASTSLTFTPATLTGIGDASVAGTVAKETLLVDATNFSFTLRDLLTNTVLLAGKVSPPLGLASITMNQGVAPGSLAPGAVSVSGITYTGGTVYNQFVLNNPDLVNPGNSVIGLNFSSGTFGVSNGHLNDFTASGGVNFSADEDTGGQNNAVPLPASVWGGLGTMAVLGGLQLRRKFAK